jgi:hypothetical protein
MNLHSHNASCDAWLDMMYSTSVVDSISIQQVYLHISCSDGLQYSSIHCFDVMVNGLVALEPRSVRAEVMACPTVQYGIMFGVTNSCFLELHDTALPLTKN